MISIREPGGTALGEALRDLLQHQTEVDIHMQAEWLLFSASRAQLIHEVIEPALKKAEHGFYVIALSILPSPIRDTEESLMGTHETASRIYARYVNAGYHLFCRWMWMKD